MLSSLNVFTSAGLQEADSTVIQGQNLTLPPTCGDLYLVNGPIGVTVPRANAQGAGPLSNNSNRATFVGNLTGADRCEKVWTTKHKVLSFQQVKQEADRSLCAGRCWQSYRGGGTALDERL